MKPSKQVGGSMVNYGIYRSTFLIYSQDCMRCITTFQCMHEGMNFVSGIIIIVAQHAHTYTPTRTQRYVMTCYHCMINSTLLVLSGSILD